MLSVKDWVVSLHKHQFELDQGDPLVQRKVSTKGGKKPPIGEIFGVLNSTIGEWLTVHPQIPATRCSKKLDQSHEPELMDGGRRGPHSHIRALRLRNGEGGIFVSCV